MNNKEKVCSLSDSELIEVCKAEVSEMCKTGGRSFTMRVSANLNKDTDLVLAELIERFKALITENVQETPRRDQMHIYCDAEKAIDVALQETEKMGRHGVLNEAIALLTKAKNLVADDVDETVLKMNQCSTTTVK